MTIADLDHVGFQKLELWDSIGNAAGGQFVINNAAQSGGHEIDVAPGDIADSAFDVGTLGGTDQLWAQLLQANGQLTGWMPFTVGAPAAQLPTLTVNSQTGVTAGQSIALTTLVSITDPDNVSYQMLELWDSNGTAQNGQFVINGLAQSGGHEIDVNPTDVANSKFDVGRRLHLIPSGRGSSRTTARSRLAAVHGEGSHHHCRRRDGRDQLGLCGRGELRR